MTRVNLRNTFRDYFTNLFSPVQLASGGLRLTQSIAENYFLLSTGKNEVLWAFLNLENSKCIDLWNTGAAGKIRD